MTRLKIKREIFYFNYVAVDFWVVEESADGRRLAVRQHKQVVLGTEMFVLR